jgi:Ca2+-binding RTX toxin-like protein
VVAVSFTATAYSLANVVGNVSTVRNSADGQPVTLASPAGTILANAQAVPNPSPSNAPAGVTFPVGFFSFQVHGLTAGGSATVTLSLPAGVTVDTYYRYGPTPGSPQPHWYPFSYNGLRGAVIDNVNHQIVLHFVDGGIGDDDLAVNGIVVDAGAPAVLVPTTTSIATSVSPSVFAQPVTYTATVASAVAGSLTGTVTFFDGSTPLATLPLTGGRAQFTTAALDRGSHAITATYNGDGEFKTSTSSAVTQTVQTVALEPDPLQPTQANLVVGGTAGADFIHVGAERGGRQLDVQVTQVGGSFHFTDSVPTAQVSRLVIFSGPGNDVILVDDAVILPALLFGGAGNNLLKGGGGPSVLVGGPGRDVLIGGLGLSVLIGGGGSDLLLGRGPAILIGGRTDYDANLAALEAVLAEWDRNDANYQDRVAHLLGSASGGRNGSVVLNATTVHADNASELLVGLTGLDWYFAGLSHRPVLVGKRSTEVVTWLT